MSNAAYIQVPSAAPITPSPAATLTSASSSREVDAVFDGIDALLAACRGASVTDRLTALIPALIERGMNTRPRIVGAARKKGFNEDRTSRFLTEMTGKLWLRGKDGIYTVSS